MIDPEDIKYRVRNRVREMSVELDLAIDAIVAAFNAELEEIRRRLPDPGYRCVVEREDGE